MFLARERSGTELLKRRVGMRGGRRGGRRVWRGSVHGSDRYRVGEGPYPHIVHTTYFRPRCEGGKLSYSPSFRI